MHSIRRLLGNSASSSAAEICCVSSRWARRSANHWAGVMVACILFLASSVSLAQRVVTATASIPFDFLAAGQKFAAGEYIFDSGFPGSTSIRRKGTNLTVAIPIVPYGDPVRKEDARIVFVLRDGNYYLVEFRGILDRRVVTAEFEHRGQTSSGQREVQLSYPQAQKPAK